MTVEEYKELTGMDYAAYGRMVVAGDVIYETETHYFTAIPGGTTSWSKKWYRLMA